MSIVLATPPRHVTATFERAMAAIPHQPGHLASNKTYRHLPPLIRLTMTSAEARNEDVQRARAVGWRFLIEDDQGFGVVDLADTNDKTFSSFRRHDFAIAYARTLATVDGEFGSDKEMWELYSLEIPSLAASSLVSRRSGLVLLHVVMMSGRFEQSGAKMSPESFFAEVFRSKRNAPSNSPDEDPSPKI